MTEENRYIMVEQGQYEHWQWQVQEAQDREDIRCIARMANDSYEELDKAGKVTGENTILTLKGCISDAALVLDLAREEFLERRKNR